eukprot:TRINITY_DN5412_c0_g1_i2.p1 TRINITY_DN5412_c0_g1~~TRINITY_DN5412_c0_g1_i2.p1  ORF type:complete len:730 (+),score=57.81 TRINITY_DN5412_c0_g1_i2:39-2228(+)
MQPLSSASPAAGEVEAAGEPLGVAPPSGEVPAPNDLVPIQLGDPNAASLAAGLWNPLLSPYWQTPGSANFPGTTQYITTILWNLLNVQIQAQQIKALYGQNQEGATPEVQSEQAAVSSKLCEGETAPATGTEAPQRQQVDSLDPTGPNRRRITTQRRGKNGRSTGTTPAGAEPGVKRRHRRFPGAVDSETEGAVPEPSSPRTELPYNLRNRRRIALSARLRNDYSPITTAASATLPQGGSDLLALAECCPAPLAATLETTLAIATSSTGVRRGRRGRPRKTNPIARPVQAEEAQSPKSSSSTASPEVFEEPPPPPPDLGSESNESEFASDVQSPLHTDEGRTVATDTDGVGSTVRSPSASPSPPTSPSERRYPQRSGTFAQTTHGKTQIATRQKSVQKRKRAERSQQPPTITRPVREKRQRMVHTPPPLHTTQNCDVAVSAPKEDERESDQKCKPEVIPEVLPEVKPPLASVPEPVEYLDEEAVFLQKMQQVAQWVRRARHVVVQTGAGITTSAGIPDYRGPTGVWTMKAKGTPVESKWGQMSSVIPTLCHRGIAELVRRGTVKHVITTNVDNLHQRSGISPSAITELHGNIFVGVCNRCHQKIVSDAPMREKQSENDFDHDTGKPCPTAGCQGILQDTIVNFEEFLCQDLYQRAQEMSSRSDLMIVLGSSLTVPPSNQFPKNTLKRGGRLVICNKMATRYSNRPNVLQVYAPTDRFMETLLQLLEIDP